MTKNSRDYRKALRVVKRMIKSRNLSKIFTKESYHSIVFGASNQNYEFNIKVLKDRMQEIKKMLQFQSNI